MAQNEYDVLVNLQANANNYEKEIADLKTQYSQISSTGAVEETQKVWENLKKARTELSSIQAEMQKVASQAVKVRLGAGDNGVPKISSELLTGLKTTKGGSIRSGGVVDVKTLTQGLWKANAGADPSILSEGQQKILMVLQGLAAKKVTYEPGVETKSNRYIRVGNNEAKRETMKTLASRHGYELKETATKNWAGELENALSYEVTSNKPEPTKGESKALDNIATYIQRNLLPNMGFKDSSSSDKKLTASLRDLTRGVQAQKREQQNTWAETHHNFGEILSQVYENNDSEILEITKEAQSRVDREGKESDYSKALRSAADEKDSDVYLRRVAERMGVPTVRGSYHPKTFEEKRVSLDEYAKNNAAMGDTLKAHGGSYQEDSVDNLIKKIMRFAYSGEIYDEMQQEGNSLTPWDSTLTDDTKMTLDALKALTSNIRQNQTPEMKKFTEGSAKGKSFSPSEITNFFGDLYNILLDYVSGKQVDSLGVSDIDKAPPEVETRLKTMLINIQKVLQAATQNPDEVLDQDNLTTLMSQMLTEVEKTNFKGKKYVGYSRDAVRALRAKEGLQTYDEKGNDVTGLYPIADIPDSATGHLYQFPAITEEYRHSEQRDEMGQARLGKAFTDTEAKVALMDKLFSQLSDLSEKKQSQGFLTNDQQKVMEDAVKKANLLFEYFVNTISNQTLAWENGEDTLPNSDIEAMNIGISSFLKKANTEKWVNVNGNYKPKNLVTKEEKSQTIADIKANSENSDQSIGEIEAEIQQLFNITGKDKDNLLEQAKSWNNDLKEFKTFISNLLGKKQEDYTDYDIEDEQSLYKSDFVKDMDFPSLIGREGNAFYPDEIAEVAKKMNADEYEFGMTKEDRDVLTLYQQLDEKLKQAKSQKAIDSLAPYIEKYKDADKVGKTAISKKIREVLGDSTADYWKANKKELLKKISSSKAETLTPVITSPAIPSKGSVIDVDYKEVNKSNQEAGKNIEETNRQAQSQVEETTKKVTEESQQVVELNNNFEVHKANVEEAIKAEQNKFEVSKTLTEQLDKEKTSLEALNKAFTDHAQVVASASTAEAKVDTSAKVEQPKEEPKKEVRTPSEQGTVTSTWAKIANYDDVNHIYTDEKGNQLTSLTTLAGYLKGTTSNPTFREDSKVIRNAVAGLNYGETLTPEMVGMNTKNFNSLTHTLAAIEKGNLEHEVIDLMAKTGSKSIEDLQKSNTMVESKWGSDGTQLKNGQTRMVKASEEYARVLQEKTDFLKKLGVENSEEQMLASTKAYMEALNAGGIALTKFSEVPMAATFSGNRGDYSFAFTPDQIGRDSAGNGVILDSKTGKTFGTESFQLAGQLYGILANKDNPEFEELYKGLNVDEDFTTYIAKIDGVFTQLIKHMQLTKEEFYDLLADANDIATGKQEPLTKYQQTARMNRELQTGRIGALDTSADGKTQSQNLSIGGNNFVSYAEGSKEENKVVQEYLSESSKKLSYQKQIAALESQIRELSKDGARGSKELLESLKKQKKDLINAAHTQKEYMRDKRLEKKTVDVNGASQTRIGNVILSNSAANKVNNKEAIANYQAQAAQERSAQSARKASATEQKKEVDNLIKQQERYLKLKEQEFELERQLQGATGQKAEEINNSLNLNRQIQRENYSDFTTGQLDENGGVLSNESDYKRITDKIKGIKGLSEQTIVEIQNRTDNMFNDYDQQIQKLRQKYAQSAGSNTVNTTSLITQYLKAQEQRGKLEVERQRAAMKGQNLSGTQAIENRAFVGSIDRQISQIDNSWKYDAAQKSLNGQALTEEEINRLETERGRIIAQNNQQLSNMQTNLSNSKSFLEKMADNFVQSFKQIGSYLMSMFSFQGIERVFTNLVSRTSELDSKMVDLQIASGYSRDEIKRMMQDFNKLGKEIGKTTTEIAEAANDWLRAGYEGSEASKLTEASMNLATLGMINSSDATSYLISVMKGWKLEASEIDEVVDKLVKTDMAAAISAGDLAEAMSRANNSAQMAGSTLDRYIGYLTTITDVTQKSAASVGESMKTIYSRYQNIAAGKFVAAQSDIDSENYNEDDWENLNDVETALGALGIKIRDSVDNFRSFDDVMTEIASKWDSYSDVQQSGIATALAGTRQRENVITMFENFDLVQKYEQIAANSYGTAAQKMEAYTDSMEAARTRMTASLEKWTLALDGSKALKVFYNAVADVSDNLVAWSTSIIAMMALTNTAGVGTGIQNGLGKIWSVLANSQISSMNRQETFANYWGKGGMGGVWARIKENIEGDFLASQKEVFSKSLNATIKNMDALSESAKTMLSDGMVPLQNTLLNMTAGDKEFYGKLLASGEALDKYRISTVKGMLQKAGNSAVEAVLGTVTEAEKNARLAAIEATNGGKVEEAKLQYATELLADERNKAARQQIGQDLLRSSQMNAKKAAVSGALTGGLTIGGLLLGNTIGESLGGGTGQAVGSLIGMSLGNSLAKQVAASIGALPKNATVMAAVKAGLGGMFTGVGAIITPLLIAAIPIVIAGFVKKAKNKVKEEAANLAKEASETYTNTLNASAEAVNFDKLVNGVDYLGRNVSLTDEEYQKFLDSSNALAEAFPELVVRTDELGNKFVGPDGLSGQVGAVTQKIDELTEASRKAADSELFKMKDVTFAGINVGKKSGFSNVFDEQSKILGEANNTLKYKAKTVYGVDVQGLNQEIALRESTLENISKNKGTDSDEYKKAKKQLDQLKLDRDALFEDINTAKDTLAEYTEQLISYANTANGQAEFEGQFGNIEDQLNDMSDNGKNLVLSSVKLAIRDMEFTDEEDYKNKVLSLTQKAADLLENNPVIADIYYGIGEFRTLGDQQDAMEKMIPVLEEIFGADGYDDAEKAIIEHLGLKIIVDGDKVSIEVPSLGEQFKEQLKKGWRYSINENATNDWSNFIGGLTQDQYKQLFDWAGNGWISGAGASTQAGKDTLMRMLNGGNYYNGTDLDMLAVAANQKYQDFRRQGNGRTQVGNDLTSRFTDYANKRAAGENVNFGSYKMSKQEIASTYANMGEDVWKQIEALQDELETAAPEAIQESLTNGINSIDFSVLKEGLSGKIKEVTEAANQYFSGIDVEGYIDSWKELKDAFASVKDIYEQIDTARKEQNATGRLSVETVLDLLASNEDYVQALTVENEQIRLKSDAEEIMNKVRLQTLATSIQTSIEEKKVKDQELVAELAAIDNGAVYTKTLDQETEMTNYAIEANNRHAESLAQMADEALTAADALNLVNQANAGEIVDTSGVKPHDENQERAKKNAVEKVIYDPIDYSKLTEQAKERRAEILDILEQDYGTRREGWNYDATTGEFTAILDKEGHEVGGNIGVLQHLLAQTNDVIKNGSGSGTFSKVYDSYKDASKDAKDTAKDLLKALDSIIDKEWEAMQVWDEYNQKSTGYTAYFEKKRASLERLAGMAKAEMDSAKTEEERADAEKDYIEYQKAINNLDDEEVEDKINILELQGASLDKLIAMQKVYIQTSDTEEENLERNKKLVELLHQQVELHREVSEWQRDNTDRLIDRLSGDAYGNEAYDRAIGQQIEAVNDEMADTQKQIQMYYAEAVKGYEKSGSTHAEALRLAYTGNSDASQSLRDEMTKYYDLIDKRTEYTIKKMEDKADDLNRRLDLIEKEKPDEWFKIGDIDSYYTQRMDLLQKQVELYQDTLKDTSDMTDEQIQNIVDSLNEATLNLKQAQIDNLKDQTDLQSKQYDAIVYRINLWKDEIQDAIDAIEDAYEDEIKPIQDINDELERQGKLEDLLAAKKAAEQSKERVFREGIGWVTDKCTPMMDYIG